MVQSYEAAFFDEHFSDVMSALEKRAEGGLDFYEIFCDIDINLFFFLLTGRFEFPKSVRNCIPDWPPEDIRIGSTSDLPLNLTMLESRSFWQTIKRAWEAYSPLPVSQCRVADYGAGWGRIARFVAHDIPTSQLYAYEPNPTFQDYFRKCRVPGTLIPTDWQSMSPLDKESYDIVYCFSILTHASDALIRRIVERWCEITRPGSLVFTTIRPGYFLEAVGGDADLIQRSEKAAAREAYNRGELVYRPYSDGGGPDWGVTVPPLSYLERVFGDHFSLDGVFALPTTMNQLIISLRRI